MTVPLSCVEQLAHLESLVREYFAAYDDRSVGLQFRGAVRERMIRARQRRLRVAENELRAAITAASQEK